MSIFLGLNSSIKSIYWESHAIKSAYYGNQLVFTSAANWVLLESNIIKSNMLDVLNSLLDDGKDSYWYDDFKIKKNANSTYNIYHSTTGVGDVSSFQQYTVWNGSVQEEIFHYTQIISVLDSYEDLGVLIFSNTGDGNINGRIYYTSNMELELYDWDCPNSPIGTLQDAQYMLDEGFNMQGSTYVMLRYFASDQGVAPAFTQSELSADEWSTWTLRTHQVNFTDAEYLIPDNYMIYGDTEFLYVPIAGSVWYDVYGRKQ